MLKSKVAIIINTIGIFGGAERRFTNLFKYLYEKYPDKVYYFISYSLYNRIKEIYPDFKFDNVFYIGPEEKKNSRILITSKVIKANISEKKLSFFRKFYKLQKNYFFQKNLFREIHRITEQKNIKVFLGVASGILPLYFYYNGNYKKSIIFSNMDSWFTDVVNEKDLWYRKYSSYNLAMLKSDLLDFLNPFILNGVRSRGINIDNDRVSISPCSFSDYSKCNYGNKTKFQVAFSGRLEQRKNPILFLEAAIELSKKYPDIMFHIMGEGRLSQTISERCRMINSENIIFHGFHPNPPEILSDTSVFVSIQETNNYPSQSVLEAMACGNAIVASDVGDTRMFINEKNGILVNLNKSELIKAIETLYLNRTLCREMGEFAYKYVRKEHTIDRVAEYYLNLFERAEKLKK